jgi:hypothetical protein
LRTPIRRAAACALSVAAVLSAAATPAMAPASAPAREQREPTDAEVRTFAEFFAQRIESAGATGAAKPLLLPPVLKAERAAKGKAGQGPWQLSAQVDTKPRHGAVDLCHIIRSRFLYDAGQRWREDGTSTEYVWLSGGPVACGAPKQLVELPQPLPALPAADIVRLLAQQAPLLSRARLLFAGNTSCARQRAYQFELAAIDSAAPEKGASAMYALTYRSDRATTARVTVRKSGTELTAWNVSCAQQAPG